MPSNNVNGPTQKPINTNRTEICLSYHWIYAQYTLYTAYINQCAILFRFDFASHFQFVGRKWIWKAMGMEPYGILTFFLLNRMFLYTIVSLMVQFVGGK